MLWLSQWRHNAWKQASSSDFLAETLRIEKLSFSRDKKTEKASWKQKYTHIRWIRSKSKLSAIISFGSGDLKMLIQKAAIPRIRWMLYYVGTSTNGFWSLKVQISCMVTWPLYSSILMGASMCVPPLSDQENFQKKKRFKARVLIRWATELLKNLLLSFKKFRWLLNL